MFIFKVKVSHPLYTEFPVSKHKTVKCKFKGFYLIFIIIIISKCRFLSADPIKNNARATSYLSGVRISAQMVCDHLQGTAKDKHPENGTFACFYSLGLRNSIF